MASREETRAMKKLAQEYGLRDPKLDPAGDPVIYSRTRGEDKDQLFLYNLSGPAMLAAFIYAPTARKLGSKITKLEAVGCKVHQQSREEATLGFSNACIPAVSKILKCDKIVRKQTKKQVEALRAATKKRKEIAMRGEAR